MTRAAGACRDEREMWPMPNSESERREVAERLRKYAKTVTHNPEYLWAHLEIAVNGWHMGASVDKSYVYDNEVLSRLADLIEPEPVRTCHDSDHGCDDGIKFKCDMCQNKDLFNPIYLHRILSNKREPKAAEMEGEDD